ncbi:ATP-binding protein [Pseudomonas sp. N3-W]|uniref:AAA family ATPase n=1 Tax=Pseudomonas sp. N3-W TaxID=2975049 RepID=UPI00217E1E58|nr:ATP-binding protein [Pseudomonas sp. N3-W]UWF50420.1 ATP-binding protein [Pseudomonas sp. N3-W]
MSPNELKPDNETLLHLICGKIASGKSTLTGRLALAPKTLLLSEDEWLSRLYPGQINSLGDYVRCTGLLRDALSAHVVALLKAGISVVLDFPANTQASRRWMRSLFEAGGVNHRLHYLDVPDEVCKARLRSRNAAGTHAFETSDAQFELITGYFEAPSPAEDFNVVRYDARQPAPTE